MSREIVGFELPLEIIWTRLIVYGLIYFPHWRDDDATNTVTNFSTEIYIYISSL